MFLECKSKLAVWQWIVCSFSPTFFESVFFWQSFQKNYQLNGTIYPLTWTITLSMTCTSTSPLREINPLPPLTITHPLPSWTTWTISHPSRKNQLSPPPWMGVVHAQGNVVVKVTGWSGQVFFGVFASWVRSTIYNISTKIWSVFLFKLISFMSVTFSQMWFSSTDFPQVIF